MGIVARTAAWLYMLRKLVTLAYESSVQVLPQLRGRLLDRQR